MSRESNKFNFKSASKSFNGLIIGPYGSLSQDNIVLSLDVNSSMPPEALVKFVVLKFGRRIMIGLVGLLVSW